MEYLTLKQISKTLYEVHFECVTLGEFVMDVDGYFYLDITSKGLLSDYILLELGNKLKELNKDWNEKIRKLNE